MLAGAVQDTLNIQALMVVLGCSLEVEGTADTVHFRHDPEAPQLELSHLPKEDKKAAPKFPDEGEKNQPSFNIYEPQQPPAWH